ncbi:peptidase inhibitor family I36 protein [Streptomyces capillispiralis]|nr:hypothetical protein GCM10017779_21600 [Streptomyces capillispiralis]
MRSLRRAATAVAMATLALTGTSVAGAGSASADTPHCPSGYFCAFEHVNFTGTGYMAAGSDASWPEYINRKDSSWANAGITGPGIPAWVKVYPLNFQLGASTICLSPGREVSHLSYANDGGRSHGWYHGC